MSTCRQARRWMERAFDGRLGVDEDFLLQAHLEDCPRCREEAELSAALVEGLTRQPEPPLERLDVERALEAIHERLGEEPVSTPRPGRGLPLLRVAVAAGVTLVAGLWLLAGDGPVPASSEVEVGAGPEIGPEATPIAVTPEASETSAPQLVDGSPVASPDPQLASAVRVYPLLPSVSEVDLARHAQVATEVRDALASSATEHPEDLDACLAAFEEATRHLVEGAWPVERVVAALVRDPDPHVAGAACRSIGRGATRLGVRRLVEALDSPVALAAADALVDAGPLGRDALARAVWVPGATDRVLASQAELEVEARLDWAAAALEQAPRGAALGPWLAFVGDSGRAGADALLLRLDDARLERSAVLDALVQSPHAEEALLARLAGRVPLAARPGLLEAVRRLTPIEALPFVLEEARSGPRRGAAAEVLASYPGADVLVELLELDEERRLDVGDLRRAWERALEVDEGRVLALAQEQVSRGDRLGSRRLLEGLTLAGSPGGVPALVELAVRGALAADDREDALLVVADLGDVTSVPLLITTFHRFTLRDRDRAAACLVSLHRLGGAEAVGRALDGAPERTLARVMQRLQGGARASSRLLLARELEPVLMTHEAATRRNL